MDKLNPWQRLTAKMKANKKLEIGVYAGIGLLVVLLYLTGSAKPASGPTDRAETPLSAPESPRDDETRLKEALSKIKGAGAVEVMLTYENGRELVPAYETDTQMSQADGVVSSNASTRPVTVTSGGQEEAVVLKEVEPLIRGVIVIAEGAEDIGVRMDLARAASKALGVEAEKVEVFTMEKTDESK